MPLLRNGKWIEGDSWIYCADAINDCSTQHTPIVNERTESSRSSSLVCSLDDFLTLRAGSQRSVSGVAIAPEDDVMQLANYVHELQLVVIRFPAFTDGRGYSQARMLRDVLGYSGELRASGDIRPDQMLGMGRAGIDSFEFQEKVDDSLIQRIMSRFTVNYQPSYPLPIAG